MDKQRSPYPSEIAESPYVPGLDKGIAAFVFTLRQHGVETYESCQGGEGHCYPEPTIRFHGTDADGWYALCIAIDNGLPVSKLARIWTVNGAIPDGPHWEMVFDRQSTVDELIHMEHQGKVETPQPVKIRVNGRSFEVYGGFVTFEQVAKLANMPSYSTVIYTRAKEDIPSGVLICNQSVLVQDGTEFDAVPTGNA